ncbi:type II secretion system major pseudopilin GspG [Verrucomicrobiales bacterium]|nr:type II secretion system major pseudopilin GspG [Verrucomicrobiales bacterium]
MVTTNRRASGGFTLMEMVLVLAIISLLVGLGAFAMKNVLSDADVDKARADVRSLETNLVRYKAKAGFFPTTEQGLKALVEPPTAPPKPKRWTQSTGPEALIDSWGQPYQYKNPGSRNSSGQDVFSMGPDMIAGNEDDVGNW